MRALLRVVTPLPAETPPPPSPDEPARDVAADHARVRRVVREAADQRAIAEVRAENAELTRDYRIALDAARNAGLRTDPSATAPTPPSAAPVPPVPSLARHHDPPSSSASNHFASRAGCDPHDPLCGDLPEGD